MLPLEEFAHIYNAQTAPICDLLACHRRGPHWVGEYGCAASNVWRCPEGGSVEARCKGTGRGSHWRGCGCEGDPATHVSAGPLVPQWTPNQLDRARFIEWWSVQPRAVVRDVAELDATAALLDSVVAQASVGQCEHAWARYELGRGFYQRQCARCGEVLPPETRQGFVPNVEAHVHKWVFVQTRDGQGREVVMCEVPGCQAVSLLEDV